MSVPASVNLLAAIPTNTEGLMTALATNRLFLNDCLDFLFQTDPAVKTVFVLTGDFGLFLAGAAVQYGVNNLIVDQKILGDVDPDFKKVVVITERVEDSTNPAEIWRELSRVLFPRKERRVLIESRCLLDQRAELSPPHASAVENTEMIVVKSMSGLAPR